MTKKNKYLLYYTIAGLIVGGALFWLLDKKKTQNNMKYLVAKGISEDTLNKYLAADPKAFKEFMDARVKAYKAGQMVFSVYHPKYNDGKTMYLTSNPSKKT